MDARGRGSGMTHVPEQVKGIRAHRRPSPGARERAFGDHERGDRRRDGSVHAEERVGLNKALAEAVALERAKSGPCRCAVPAVSRPRKAMR
jgi:hypothetical protein